MIGDRLLYLSDYLDEVLPDLGDQGLTPEGWASWLAHPDKDWNREEAAKIGETFDGHFVVIVDAIARAVDRVPGQSDLFRSRSAGAVTVASGPPATATWFAPRLGPGLGWDVDDIRSTWAEIVEEFSGQLIACMTDEPERRFSFNIVDGRPVLQDLGAVQ